MNAHMMMLLSMVSITSTGCFLFAYKTNQLRGELRTDKLTGLPNREALAVRLDRVRRRASHIGLLLLDLDEFKQINDGFGHIVGDKALKFVANTLRAAALPGELVVRLHGDEFAVLIGSVPSGYLGMHTANLRADEIIRVLKKNSLRINARDSLNLAASIGIAALPAKMADLGVLLSMADRAMYKKKRVKTQNPISSGSSGLIRRRNDRETVVEGCPDLCS